MTDQQIYISIYPKKIIVASKYDLCEQKEGILDDITLWNRLSKIFILVQGGDMKILHNFENP